MSKEKNLAKIAQKVRINIIKMITEAQSGHPGGSLSCTDMLVSLYFKHLNHNPDKPNWKKRDRFVLSKGHAVPALYAVLAEAGYFPEKELSTLRNINSPLQGHPSYVKCPPGIEASSGSLGQGFPQACGMAIGLKNTSSFVFTIIGDGESQEGIIWEAALFAKQYQLKNLIAFTDRNNLQIDGKTENVIGLEPLSEKWKAFGWHVQEIDGHSFTEIDQAILEAKKTPLPSMIIANTIKGKGVHCMENAAEWHGKAPSPELAQKSIAVINNKLCQ